MPYETDRVGFPKDPVLRKLEKRAIAIAGTWRCHHNDEEFANQLVEEYHDVLLQMLSMGWDRGFAYEELLPDDLMPEEYLEFFRR